MTLIEILFNHVRKNEPETRWEREGRAFTFPITIPRIARVWAAVQQESAQIFIGVGLIERSRLGAHADCVSTALLRENGAPNEILTYAITRSPEGSELLALRTFFDYRTDNQDSQTYVARFNSRYTWIKRYVDEFDGLLNRLLEQCGGD